MRPSLQLQLQQQLTITPQLQQAIRLLQLSTQELNEEIQQMVEKNPLLEFEEFAEDQNTLAQHTLESTTAQWSQPTEYKNSSRIDNIDDHPNLEETYYTTTNLRDHLLWQARLSNFSTREQTIATTLIDSINDDGYLSSTLVDIEASLTELEPIVTLTEIEAVLHIIQRFDPVGVGARTVHECLSTQLTELAITTPRLNTAKQIVTHDLELFAQHRYEKIIEKYHLSADAWQYIQQLILSLSPRPGAKIIGPKSDYILPDLVVHKHHQRWEVHINPNIVPRVQINSQYSVLINNPRNTADHATLRQYLQEARWFLKSIQHRQETLLKVANCIIEQQQPFLNQGEIAIAPLTLQEIAETTQLHPSTISRVTTHKYLHTPHGIFELKYFFSSHLPTGSGTKCSSTAIRAMIKKIIAEENPNKPLSDEALTELLIQQGIKIARRTTTKYRETTGIPSSSERKSMYAKPLDFRQGASHNEQQECTS